MGVFRRILDVVVMLALCLDITVQVIWRGVFLYIPFGRSKPSARESISGWFGSAAAKGYRWGVIGASLIDRLFYEGHCAMAARIEAFNDSEPY